MHTIPLFPFSGRIHTSLVVASRGASYLGPEIVFIIF